MPVGFLPIRDATILRWGALAGVLSAFVAVAFNAIHPRAPSDSLNDTGQLLRIVATSLSWRLVHLASVVATLAGVAAIVAVLWSMCLRVRTAGQRSRLYGPRIGAIALAIAGGALGVRCGVMQALSGRLTVLSYLVLFTVSLALFTVWLTTASFVLCRKTEGLSR